MYNLWKIKKKVFNDREISPKFYNL